MELFEGVAAVEANLFPNNRAVEKVFRHASIVSNMQGKVARAINIIEQSDWKPSNSQLAEISVEDVLLGKLCRAPTIHCYEVTTGSKLIQ